MNQRDGLRISIAIGYLLQARRRQNLTIRPGCLVSRVVLKGSRAVGVELSSGGGGEVVRGRRITLSAGAIASPAILLRSGIGPRAELDALGIVSAVDLPGVGANLIDHPLEQRLVALLGGAAVAWPLAAHAQQPGKLPTIGFLGADASAFSPWTAAFVARLRELGWIEGRTIAIEYRWSQGRTERYAEIAAEFVRLRVDVIVTVGSAVPIVKQATTTIPIVFAVAVALQRPRSRGRLSLISPDPRTQPRIELNYLDHPEDMRRMVDGVRLAWRVAQWPAIARHAEHIAVLTEEMTASDELLRGYLQMTVSTIYHPVGTARMGPDGDAGAVVDQRGRVRGVDGLAVVDASIMPNVPRANINLTCIMMVERVADWRRAEE